MRKKMAMGGDDEDDEDIEDEEFDTQDMHAYNMEPNSAVGIYASNLQAAIDTLRWEPKKIVKEWANVDGIKNMTIVIALTGGAADINSHGVECKVTSDGTVFAISEQWAPLMLDMKTFYNTVGLDHGETEDEFERRRFAMEDATTAMKKTANAAVFVIVV